MENQFDRIIAVSLNPALDVTLWVNTLDFNEPNKTTDEKVYAGGKAVNIARVFASYGAENACCLGVVGSDNYQTFTQLLRADGVNFDFVQIPGAVRENLTLVIPDKRVLKVNRAGCPVSAKAMHELKDRLLAEIEPLGRCLLIFAGSLPPNITPEAYKAFILSLKRGKRRNRIGYSCFPAGRYGTAAAVSDQAKSSRISCNVWNRFAD